MNSFGFGDPDWPPVSLFSRPSFPPVGAHLLPLEKIFDTQLVQGQCVAYATQNWTAESLNSKEKDHMSIEKKIIFPEIYL